MFNFLRFRRKTISEIRLEDIAETTLNLYRAKGSLEYQQAIVNLYQTRLVRLLAEHERGNTLENPPCP